MFLIDGSGSIGADVFGNEVLRFISEFIDLFDVSPDQTRVALIQYSDQIRHEFDFGEHTNKKDLKSAILRTEYLTGLTRQELKCAEYDLLLIFRTGAAIKVNGFMKLDFSQRNIFSNNHLKKYSKSSFHVIFFSLEKMYKS